MRRNLMILGVVVFGFLSIIAGILLYNEAKSVETLSFMVAVYAVPKFAPADHTDPLYQQWLEKEDAVDRYYSQYRRLRTAAWLCMFSGVGIALLGTSTGLGLFGWIGSSLSLRRGGKRRSRLR